MLKKIKYGNTNCYIVQGTICSVMIDTDWAGTLQPFYKEIGNQNINLKDIRYLFITHFHPDHMGIAQELTDLGIRLVVLDVQVPYVHQTDEILLRDKHIHFKPINIDDAIVLKCSESREFLKQCGINGEIIYTPGHSDDSVSFILDSQAAIVGDLYPLYEVAAYNNSTINESWNRILEFGLDYIFYGHAKTANVSGIKSLDMYISQEVEREPQ